MASGAEMTCRCGERIAWLRSLLGHRHLWVHATGPQKGMEECYTDGRDDVGTPVEMDGFNVEESG
jgi:hypothetical protein